MSPRVLHFCVDQIAWECLGRKGCSSSIAAEEQPLGLPNFQLTSRGVVEGIRLKESNIDDMTTKVALSYWAQIVEAYSKTSLSHPKDKLIALSGMAKMMHSNVNANYVAGLWKTYLASQLLWRVEPVFKSINRSFSIPATAPKDCRAPSFSWAAIDVVDHSIVYGDITSQGILIKTDKVHVEPIDKENPFGMINPENTKRAKIILWGKLRAVELLSLEKGRYDWQLLDFRAEDYEMHTNVYLDCPSRDKDCIDKPYAELYVVPTRRVLDKDSQRGDTLIYLILRLESGGKAFSRIGITKLTPYMDRKAMAKRDGASDYEILKVWDSDVNLPHSDGYNVETGDHRICLI